MFADMAHEALASLQQTLRRILQRDHDNLTTPSVRRVIISILDQAVVLQLYLERFPEKETIWKVAITAHHIIDYVFSPKNLSECGSSVSLLNQLREVAEELESTTGDVVDYCKSINSSVYKLRQLSESPVVSSSPTIKDEDPTVLIEPTVRLTNRLGKLAEKFSSTATDDLVSKDVRLGDSLAVSSSSSRPAPNLKGSMAGSIAESSTSRLASTGSLDPVGLDRDVLAIKERLFEDTKQLQILPIVGTGGIGKTTLARTVYHDPYIIGKFDVRAWVTVSQDYSFGDIFKSLLVSMKDFVRDDISGLNNQEMAEKVRQTLYRRRYLIVIDDMWSTKSWDEVRIYFPGSSEGSRIILTTRLEDVAAYADSSKQLHKMQFLDADQSWKLLRKEVFRGDYHLDALERIGRKIAKSCGGLPLAIVVVAGLLSKVSQTEADWEHIANDINLAITADVEEYSAILSLSYNDMSHQMRQCFLYMGAFPEDYEIRVSKLIKLWVAEGFIELTATKSPEEKAEELLEDLVKRNLVLVTKKKSNGKIKSCGLHDLLRDLCLIKSLEENFLLSFMGSFLLPEIFETQLRISISHSNILEHIDGSTIRTIICYGHRSVNSLGKFRLLRILDMLNTNVPDHVFEMHDMRLLAFCYSTVSIPASISNLQNLQALILYSNDQCMVNLPIEIWKMSKLRHLVSSSFHPLPHPSRATPPLGNLQTLSLVTNFVCSERMVKMIRNVKKLGICYSGEKFDKDYHLKNLKRLVHLEKLKLEIRSDFPFGESLNPVFPELLRKLTLSGWPHPWEDLSIIGSLPNLQVLKLINHACDCSIWVTTEGEFNKLEYLLIEKSNLQQWCTDSSHFRKLKWLVLRRCLHLSEIPDDIGDIPTLEMIEVEGCYQNLVDSVKKIQDYSIQVRYSNVLSTDHHQE